MSKVFETSKRIFEECIGRMQKDLFEYANDYRASEKAVQFRKDQINQLIDFYQKAIALLEELESKFSQLMVDYNELHHDTQRLVHYATLHGINPNEVFFWSLEELESMFQRGLRFQLPLHEKNADWELRSLSGEKRSATLNDFYETNQQLSNKYIQVRALVRRARNAS